MSQPEEMNHLPPETPPAGEAQATAVPTPPLPRWRSRRLVRVGGIVLLLGVSAVAVCYLCFRGPTSDLGRFQGDWKLVPGGRSEQEGYEGPVQVAVRIQGDRWQYVIAGARTKTLQISLDESANPKEIELTLLDSPSGGPKSHGIYAIEGNTARVLVVPADRPRPTSLDDFGENVWVLTRVRLNMPK